MYKYNPLLAGKLDRVDTGDNELNDLDDVNTAGTVNDKVLTYQSGTWIPKAVAGVGDMLKAEYVSGHGTVYNASRLEGDTLATVQAHTVDAVNISGTVADAHIPDLETLSYGAAFATAQVPAIGAYKVASGTLNANQIPSLPTARITSGTFGLARIPAIDDARIPDVDTLSYSGAFATAQIPDLAASKITSGTFGLARIPAIDDARIPDLDTLSYGAAFATAQIPSIGAYKIGSGTFSSGRIPILPTDRYGSAVLLTGAQSIGGTKTFTDIPILPASNPTADNEAARKAYVDSAAGGDIDGGIYSDTYVNTADVDGGTF